MEQFWYIVQSPVHLILEMLDKSSVPKIVLKSGGECDSIQKKSVDSLQKNQVWHYKCAPNLMLSKHARSN
jgi:hypothetical protein